MRIGSVGRLLMRSNSSSSEPPDQNDSSNCPARPFSRFSRIAFSKMIAQLQKEAKSRMSITTLTTMSACMNRPNSDRSAGGREPAS
jgi:hypothetical protein